MVMERLTAVEDMSVGAWIAPRLDGSGGRVCHVVPRGYEGYVRVLHPLDIGPGGVARATSEGNLRPPALTLVLDVLAGFTRVGEECFHAVWDGWGWIDGQGMSLLRRSEKRRWGRRAPRSTPLPPPSSPLLALPRLVHPGRQYLLFRGVLEAAAEIGYEPLPSRFSGQSPSILWPSSRAWCLATEIDFDSTLVGGPAQLVDALLAHPELEAWPVEPGDDLSWAGDTVNG